MVNTLTEIWGEPGSGKTHAALSGWPNPLLVDTAFTSLGFRDIEVDPDPDEEGESWPVLLKLNDYDHEAASKQYMYLESWPSDYDFADGYETVIIDNAADLRVIAVKEWASKPNNSDWPQQAEWGEINDMLDEMIRHLRRNHHVVVISQMKAEYVNGDRTGELVRDGPKRMDYKADYRIRMEVVDRTRHAWVEKNRFMDAAGGGEEPEHGARGSDIGPDFDYEELMLVSGVPESEW